RIAQTELALRLRILSGLVLAQRGGHTPKAKIEARMNVRILGYFSLGAMILCGLVLVLTFKWIETALASGGQISIWGLVRWYVVLIVLFSPWLYFTLANRLKVQG